MDIRVGVSDGVIVAAIGSADTRDTSREEAAAELDENGTPRRVTWVTLTGEDRNSWDTRSLNVGWEWDSVNQVGVEPVDRAATRLLVTQREADVHAIVDGTFTGTADEAIALLARVITGRLEEP